MQTPISFVRIKTAQERLGNVARSTVYRWVDAGLLPKLIPIAPNTSVFDAEEFEAALVRMKRGEAA